MILKLTKFIFQVIFFEVGFWHETVRQSEFTCVQLYGFHTKNKIQTPTIHQIETAWLLICLLTCTITNDAIGLWIYEDCHILILFFVPSACLWLLIQC